MPIISQPEGPRCCPALYPWDHGTSETGALAEWGKQQFDITESELAFVVWFFFWKYAVPALVRTALQRLLGYKQDEALAFLTAWRPYG